MKNLVILLILFFSSTVILGQEKTEKKEKKWSAGINLSSFGIDYYDRPVFRIWNGVTVKRKHKSFAIRMGAEYFFKTYHKHDLYYTLHAPSYEGKLNEFILKLGIEKRMISVKFVSLYGALDLFGSRQYSDLEIIGGGYKWYNENRKQTVYSFGIVPVLGLEFKLKNNFSLITEIRAAIPYKYIKTQSTHLDTGVVKKSNNKQFGYYNDKGMAALSLSYRF